MAKRKLQGVDSIITDCLYLGNAKASRNLDVLKSVGITHIVCLAGKDVFQNDFIYYMCHFKDKGDSDILQLLPSVFEFMDHAIAKEKGKVYTHCMAGMSRSPSIVMAYLMCKFRLTLKEAYIYVMSKRSCIRPNYVFLQQLLKYETALFGEHFTNSIADKDLRNISSLYKKRWKKEVQKKQFDHITAGAIIEAIRKQKKIQCQLQTEEHKGQ
eukprot:204950_1